MYRVYVKEDCGLLVRRGRGFTKFDTAKKFAAKQPLAEVRLFSAGCERLLTIYRHGKNLLDNGPVVS